MFFPFLIGSGLGTAMVATLYPFGGELGGDPFTLLNLYYWLGTWAGTFVVCYLYFSISEGRPSERQDWRRY
jgi:hypothetical protein